MPTYSGDKLVHWLKHQSLSCFRELAKAKLIHHLCSHRRQGIKPSVVTHTGLVLPAAALFLATQVRSADQQHELHLGAC